MEEITLQALLEAGCHFGHKAERWHPKAAQFIYAEKDGVHIIDLVKTKEGLDKAVAFVREFVANGGELLFVGTKRQAKAIVKDEAVAAGAPYITERWIGGFLTNWDGIHKNIKKINRLTDELATGGWKNRPKHEQFKLGRYLNRLKIFYGGVLTLNTPPKALFIVDVKKEIAAVREAVRTNIPIIAIVDTNANPTGIDYAIPANDDAVGSVGIITKAVANAYASGKAEMAKNAEEARAAAAAKVEARKAEEAKKQEAKSAEVTAAERKAAEITAGLKATTVEEPQVVPAKAEEAPKAEPKKPVKRTAKKAEQPAAETKTK